MTAATFRRVWGAPLVLAAATAAGLLAALFGDGVWDWLSTLLLAAPVLAALQRLACTLRGTAE